MNSNHFSVNLVVFENLPLERGEGKGNVPWIETTVTACVCVIVVSMLQQLTTATTMNNKKKLFKTKEF